MCKVKGSLYLPLNKIPIAHCALRLNHLPKLCFLLPTIKIPDHKVYSMICSIFCLPKIQQVILQSVLKNYHLHFSLDKLVVPHYKWCDTDQDFSSSPRKKRLKILQLLLSCFNFRGSELNLSLKRAIFNICISYAK